MPNVSAGDTLTEAIMDAIAADLDDVFANWSDRLRVRKAVSWTALRIDIWAWSFLIWNVHGTYAWWTDITVTNAATNYVHIDSSGTIQINTTWYNDDYARLASVVCSGGVVTSITLAKVDARWWTPGAPLTWSEITATSKTIVSQEAYLANNASLVTFTLPSTAAVWQKIWVMWIGAWWRKIAQNASQKIRFWSKVTTTWVSWFLQSNDQYDFVVLTCVVADTERVVESMSWNVQDQSSVWIISEYAASWDETAAFTLTDKFVTPDWLEDVLWIKILQTTRSLATTDSTQSIAHWLPQTPRRCHAVATAARDNTAAEGTSISKWYSDWTNDMCSFVWTFDAWSTMEGIAGNDADDAIHILIANNSSWDVLQVADMDFDATNVDLNRTRTSNWTAPTWTMYVTLFVHA